MKVLENVSDVPGDVPIIPWNTSTRSDADFGIVTRALETNQLDDVGLDPKIGRYRSYTMSIYKMIAISAYRTRSK